MLSTIVWESIKCALVEFRMYAFYAFKNMKTCYINVWVLGLEKIGNIAGFCGVSKVRGYGNKFLKKFFKKVLTDVEKSSIIEKYQAEHMKI